MWFGSFYFGTYMSFCEKNNRCNIKMFCDDISFINQLININIDTVLTFVQG